MSLDYGRPMGRRASIVVAVACAVAFLVLGGRLEIFGSVPSYLLVMTVCLAFIEGQRAGCAVGFAAGLAADLLGAGPVGLSALLMCVLGYVTGFGRRDYLADGWLRPLVYFALADIVYQLVYIMIASFMGGAALSASVIAPAVIRGLACDVLIAAVVFLLVNRYLSSRTTRMSGLYLSK